MHCCLQLIFQKRAIKSILRDTDINEEFDRVVYIAHNLSANNLDVAELIKTNQ